MSMEIEVYHVPGQSQTIIVHPEESLTEGLARARILYGMPPGSRVPYVNTLKPHPIDMETATKEELREWRKQNKLYKRAQAYVRKTIAIMNSDEDDGVIEDSF